MDLGLPSPAPAAHACENRPDPMSVLRIG